MGALVLANFGRLPNLTVAGRPFGRRLSQQLDASLAQAGENAVITPEKGSIILLLATDAPLDARQLRRLVAARRRRPGPHRLGVWPWQRRHRAGLSTAYTVPQLADRPMPAIAMLHETRIDPLFEVAAQACEQAIIAALWRADSVTGRDGHRRASIREAAPQWQQWLADSAF